MTDDFANEIVRPSKTGWWLTIALVATAGLAFGWFIRELAHSQTPQGRQKTEPPHGSVGSSVPELVVEGWINGDAPTADELAGKVYVLESWAFWCKPCLDSAPHTIEMYEKYKDRGVVFLGLTSEPEQNLKKSLKFIEVAKFPWPCGYGAAETLIKLYQTDEAPIPFLWVVNRQGVIAWAGHPLGLKDELLEELLKESVPTPKEVEQR